MRAADAAEKWTAMVGSSHAANTARAMEMTGAKVQLLTGRGWKLTADGVQEVVAEIERQEIAPDLIVYQVLDNNAFFSATSDGSLSLPTKGKDGRYHVRGELKVASKDQVGSIMKMVKPLLKVSPSVQKILILPIPRYLDPDRKCCNSNSHVTNAGAGLEAEIRSGLTSMKKNVRGILFKDGITNVKLLDPYTLVTNLGKDRYADPVHLMQDGYEEIAGGVLRVLAGEDERDKQADPLSSAGGAAKRIRILSGPGSGSASAPINIRGRGGRGSLFRGRGGRGRQGGSRGWVNKAKNSL
jgi:hypothetical protein